MSEVRGNHLFVATIADSGSIATAMLVEFLGLLDSVYRNLRWMTSLSAENLTPLESFVQSGVPLTNKAIDDAQTALELIWNTLPDGEPKELDLSRLPKIQISRAVLEKLDEEGYGLTVSWIEMRSPLKIGFVNVVISAVVLAAIFSGGTVNCGSMSVSLPPLGQGIAALREALKPIGGGKIAAPRIRDHIQM